MQEGMQHLISQERSWFMPPVRDGEVVKPDECISALGHRQVDDPAQAQQPDTVARGHLSTPFAERAQQAREQREARVLCQRLRDQDDCPGECVTKQVHRGVPMEELRRLDRFRELGGNRRWLA